MTCCYTFCIQLCNVGKSNKLNYILIKIIKHWPYPAVICVHFLSTKTSEFIFHNTLLKVVSRYECSLRNVHNYNLLIFFPFQIMKWAPEIPKIYYNEELPVNMILIRFMLTCCRIANFGKNQINNYWFLISRRNERSPICTWSHQGRNIIHIPARRIILAQVVIPLGFHRLVSTLFLARLGARHIWRRSGGGWGKDGNWEGVTTSWRGFPDWSHFLRLGRDLLDHFDVTISI